jgi:hypothetical protein
VRPIVDCGCDLFDDLLGPLEREPKKRCGRQNRLQARAVVLIVDVQDMLGFVNVRVHVERRREPPPVRTEEEPVIAQRVVPVSDGHIEGQPAEPLFQVRLGVRAVCLRSQPLRQFEIAGAFAVFLAQQGHRRRIEPSRTLVAVKALNAKGVKFIAESNQPGGRHVDTRLGRQAVHHIFPGSHVTVIVTRRELADPQRAVGLGEIRLGPCACERCTWRHEYSQPPAQRVQVIDSPTAEPIFTPHLSVAAGCARR